MEILLITIVLLIDLYLNYFNRVYFFFFSMVEGGLAMTGKFNESQSSLIISWLLAYVPP